MQVGASEVVTQNLPNLENLSIELRTPLCSPRDPLTISPAYASTLHAFMLTLTHLASPFALLIVY